MTVEGRITEEEFVRLNRWLFYRKPAILLLHLAVFAVGLFWSTRSGLGGSGTWMAASPLLVLAGLFLMVTHRSKQQYRRSRTLRSPLRYTLTEQGLELAAPHGRAFLGWNQITALQTTPAYYLIYGSRGEAFVVGRSWFEDSEQAEAFRRTIEDKVSAVSRAREEH